MIGFEQTGMTSSRFTLRNGAELLQKLRDGASQHATGEIALIEVSEEALTQQSHFAD